MTLRTVTVVEARAAALGADRHSVSAPLLKHTSAMGYVEFGDAKSDTVAPLATVFWSVTVSAHVGGNRTVEKKMARVAGTKALTVPSSGSATMGIAVHADAPATEYVARAHVPHTVTPLAAAYVYAAHLVQTVALAADHDPAMQSCLTAGVEHALPAVQGDCAVLEAGQKKP